MRIEKIARKHTSLFSDLANKLVYDQENVASFLHQPFSLSAFKSQMEYKQNQYSTESRSVLSSVLNTNYKSVDTSKKQDKNLDLIQKENTFTVTTGHQLSLFTGPLYFIIKILHVVQLAEELKKEYPSSNFVPIFWMASEDHDFEEINQVNIFNQKLQWETEQKGPVGRFEMTNWDGFRDQLKDLFKNHPESEVMDVINKFEGKDLAEATFNLVNALFKEYGVLALDADNRELKKLFVPIIKEELHEQKSKVAVESANEALKSAGLSSQAHAREINLFLLSEQGRERIQLKGDQFFAEGKGDISHSEMQEIVENTPEQISPNVILRPVYQECILPNLCYVGGGGEMAYWLQLKGVFEAYNIQYPLIQVRNSMMMVDHGTSGKIAAVNWLTPDLFKDVDALKKQFVLDNTEELDFTHLHLRKNDLVQAATDLVNKVDPNMKGFLESEMTRLSKQMDSLEQKLLRAEKSKFEKSLKQMDQIKDKLFPKGGLQERSASFFQFCADGEVFSHLNRFKSAIEPFENDFIVCYY